jgi:hypothetical protein
MASSVRTLTYYDGTLSDSVEVEGMKHEEAPPDWSCGAYVYDDALGPHFEQQGKRPHAFAEVVGSSAQVVITEETVIARVRWLRPEECPVHRAK